MTPTPTLIERAEAWLASYAHKNLINSHEDEAQTIIRELLALKSPRPTLDVEGVAREVRDAAQAVIDRLDTPSWKYLPVTAEHINRLRLALTLLPSTDGWRPISSKQLFAGCAALQANGVVERGIVEQDVPLGPELIITSKVNAVVAIYDAMFPPPPHSEGGK